MTVESISAWVIPSVILLAACPMLSRKKDYFAAFVAGAKNGLENAVRLLPVMIALMTALSMLQASGALAWLTEVLTRPAQAIGIPAEMIPLLVTRPVSGSASTAAYASLLEQYGPDSFAALCASVLMGSSDTLIYILSVYFSGTAIAPGMGVRRTRHAFPAAILVMLLCLFLSCAVSRIFFSGSIA